MESFILLFVFLFLSAIALAIRWLNEKIRREIALKDLKDLFLPSDDAREQQERNPYRHSDQRPLQNAGRPVDFVWAIRQIFARE
jgi:Na+-transporting methylmalonyl-CoA/oxaloacetate decarboxylase gamma subunit